MQGPGEFTTLLSTPSNNNNTPNIIGNQVDHLINITAPPIAAPPTENTDQPSNSNTEDIGDDRVLPLPFLAPTQAEDDPDETMSLNSHGNGNGNDA